MSWTLRLAAEILEAFADVGRPPPRHGRTRAEIAFDHREEDAAREAGRREWKRLRREENKARALLSPPVINLAKPGVSVVCCVRCRREVEIREGCREPVRHEPCASIRAASPCRRKKPA